MFWLLIKDIECELSSRNPFAKLGVNIAFTGNRRRVTLLSPEIKSCVSPFCSGRDFKLGAVRFLFAYAVSVIVVCCRRVCRFYALFLFNLL